MVNPAFVLLPLYLYPYNETSWSNITASITAHPDLNFQIIVAPNLANVFPDKNYEVALDALNSFTNVVTLGYVPINWIHRDLTNVLADISCYAAWPSHTNPNIAIQGIFFDETTSSLTEETWAYMSNITAFTKDALGPGKQHVSFNPGVAVDRAFYDLADTINVFENEWAAFNISALNSTPSDLLTRSTYLIHDFPPDEELQARVISGLTDANVGGMLLTTEQSYNELSDMWLEFCEVLAEKVGGGNVPDGRVLPMAPATSTSTAIAFQSGL
ncbi:Spherulation-specific family 4 [Rhexocercosporidium sp. MPI-PUGE-AT-0058]|nr:Spherulation-specific family 4 [Rhexocercosporidium sp. MPI-PUGE-AT-0058]